MRHRIYCITYSMVPVNSSLLMTVFSPFHDIITEFNCDLLWFKWQIMPPAKDRIVVSKFLKQVFFKMNIHPNKVIYRVDR